MQDAGTRAAACSGPGQADVDVDGPVVDELARGAGVDEIDRTVATTGGKRKMHATTGVDGMGISGSADGDEADAGEGCALPNELYSGGWRPAVRVLN